MGPLFASQTWPPWKFLKKIVDGFILDAFGPKSIFDLEILVTKIWRRPSEAPLPPGGFPREVWKFPTTSTFRWVLHSYAASGLVGFFFVVVWGAGTPKTTVYSCQK